MARRKSNGLLADKLGKRKAVKPRTVPLAEREDSALIQDLIMEAARSEDKELNTIAMELLVRIGKEPIQLLVLEATDPQNAPSYRVRMLKVIARIGAVPEPNAFFDYWTLLLRDPHAEVREAAALVIGSLAPKPSQPNPNQTHADPLLLPAPREQP